ncbi:MULTISPECIES: hypothetical protein [unclassified Micromonospora]|uniref:hypothetical protein n=1 Tax=unclassified Micromonospora TaxID=2617518 RepID=UPI00332DB219
MRLDRKTWLLVAGSAMFLVLALVLIAAAISAGYKAPTGEEQPKITDWMQGWGSVFGVFAGLLAAAAAAALLMHERQQVREARAELAAARDGEEQSKAQLVMTTRPSLVTHYGDIRSARVTVYNFRQSPVHWVSVSVRLSGGQVINLKTKEFIPPHDSTQVGGEPEAPIHAQAGGNRETAVVTVEFTDPAGQRWRRVNNGQPQRIAHELELTSEEESAS